MSKRTTYCGLETESLLEQEVILKGWVHNSRDIGGLIFVDLRDSAKVMYKLCLIQIFLKKHYV